MNDRSEAVTVKPCPTTGAACSAAPPPVTIADPKIARAPSPAANVRERCVLLDFAAGGPVSAARSRSKTAARRAKMREEYDLCVPMMSVPLCPQVRLTGRDLANLTEFLQSRNRPLDTRPSGVTT